MIIIFVPNHELLVALYQTIEKWVSQVDVIKSESKSAIKELAEVQTELLYSILTTIK